MMKLGNRYVVAVVCKICVIFSTFAISIFINRGLGVDAKGEYSYVVHLVELFYVFFSLGVGQTYSTFKRTDGSGIRGVFISLAIIHGFVILLLGNIITALFEVEYGAVVVILTSLAVVNVIIAMVAVVEESIKRNVLQTICNILYFLCVAILYFWGKCTLETALVCYGIHELVRIVLLMYVYKMRPSLKGISIDKIVDIYKMGIITMIVMLLISINYSIDTIMLKNLSSNYHTGLYSVGVTFSNMFLLIPDSFKEVLFGDATRNDFSKAIAIKSIKVSLLMSFIILLGFILFGKWAIVLFYGSEYVESYKLTLILFGGSLSMIFFKILQPIYITYGKQHRAALFLVISAITNIIANYFLIPIFDSIGAAVASAISYTVCGVLFIFDYIKNFDKDNSEKMNA